MRQCHFRAKLQRNHSPVPYASNPLPGWSPVLFPTSWAGRPPTTPPGWTGNRFGDRVPPVLSPGQGPATLHHAALFGHFSCSSPPWADPDTSTGMANALGRVHASEGERGAALQRHCAALLPPVGWYVLWQTPCAAQHHAAYNHGMATKLGVYACRRYGVTPSFTCTSSFLHSHPALREPSLWAMQPCASSASSFM